MWKQSLATALLWSETKQDWDFGPPEHLHNLELLCEIWEE